MLSIKKYSLLLLTCFFLFGCSFPALQNGPEPETPAPVEHVAQTSIQNASRQPASRYYFIESQLQARRGNLDTAIELLRHALIIDAESLFLRRELSIIYLQQQQPQQALTVLSEALQRRPEDLESLLLYGRIQHSLGDLEEAITSYEAILELDPGQQNTYLMLGEIYREQADQANALRIYQELIRHFPRSTAGHFHLGRIYRLSGDPVRARTHLHQSITLQPDLLEARFELAQLLRDKAAFEEMLVLYRDIVKIEPGNVRALTAIGLILASRNDPEADRIFAELGERGRTDNTVTRAIFQLYIETEAYHEALVVLEGMLAGAPHHGDLHFLTGLAHNGLNNTPEALKHFSQVDSTSRFYENAVMQTALWHQEKNRPDEAISMLESARSHLDTNVDLKLYLGILYSEVQDYHKAEQVLEEALALDPDNARLLFRLGVVYDKLDRKEALLVTMQRAVELDSEDAYILNYLGYTYAEMGVRLDEAEALILRAMELKPDDGYITDSLGWVYYKMGMFDKALKYLLIAGDLLPDDPTVMEHVGDAYTQLEDFDEALRYYQRALEVKTDKTDALEQKINRVQQKL